MDFGVMNFNPLSIIPMHGLLHGVFLQFNLISVYVKGNVVECLLSPHLFTLQYETDVKAGVTYCVHISTQYYRYR